jgi:hypothetical protein
MGFPHTSYSTHLRVACHESTPSFSLSNIILCEHLRFYTGYPKDLGPSRVIHFTSEREFVQLLHEGHPVVVAFTIRSVGVHPAFGIFIISLYALTTF